MRHLILTLYTLILISFSLAHDNMQIMKESNEFSKYNLDENINLPSLEISLLSAEKW